MIQPAQRVRSFLLRALWAVAQARGRDINRLHELTVLPRWGGGGLTLSTVKTWALSVSCRCHYKGPQLMAENNRSSSSPATPPMPGLLPVTLLPAVRSSWAPGTEASGSPRKR